MTMMRPQVQPWWRTFGAEYVLAMAGHSGGGWDMVVDDIARRTTDWLLQDAQVAI